MLNQNMNTTKMALSKDRKTRSIHIFTENFPEGEWHCFKVLKQIRIPGEDMYYLLESPLGNRLLLTAKYYSSYGIVAGAIIKCIVDKINCSGKIYLEPAHPYYKVGDRYIFQVTGNEQFTDRKGREITRLFVKGSQNNEEIATFNANGAPDIAAFISALFIGTRKGVLILKEIEVLNNC